MTKSDLPLVSFELGRNRSESRGTYGGIIVDARCSGWTDPRRRRSVRRVAVLLLRGVNYFRRLATTISAGEGSAKECRPPPGGTRLLSSAGWWP